MGELERIVLTSAFTILGGLTVLVLGQIVIKFLVEPLHEQRKLIGEIADSLIFYANVYSNPGLGEKGAMDEASEDLRRKASLLRPDNGLGSRQMTDNDSSPRRPLLFQPNRV